MNSYPKELSSIFAPLVAIQGIDDLLHLQEKDVREDGVIIEKVTADINDESESYKIVKYFLQSLNESNVRFKHWDMMGSFRMNLKYVGRRYSIIGNSEPAVEEDRDLVQWYKIAYNYRPFIFVSVYEINNGNFNDVVNEITNLSSQLQDLGVVFCCLLIVPLNLNVFKIKELLKIKDLYFLNFEYTIENCKKCNELVKYLKNRFHAIINERCDEVLVHETNVIKTTVFSQFKGVSINDLELCYDDLLKAKKKSEWLDILCLNIIRYYIKSNLNISFRKFYFHLGQSDNVEWVSKQYNWLADLISYAQNDLKLVDFNFSKANGSFNMPHQSLLYLKAYKFKTIAGIEDHNLINESINALDRIKFSRFESYNYMLLGNHYYTAKNYSMAINNYVVSLGIYKKEKWSYIVEYLLKRLISCYIKLKKFKECLRYFIELNCHSVDEKECARLKDEIDIIELEDEEEASVISVKDVMDCTVVFHNSSLKVMITNKLKCKSALTISRIRMLINDQWLDTNNVSDEFIMDLNLSPDKYTVKLLEVDFMFNDSKFQTEVPVLDFSGKYAKWDTEDEDEDKDEEYVCVSHPSNEFQITPKCANVRTELEYPKTLYNGQNLPVHFKVTNMDDDPESVAQLKIFVENDLFTELELGFQEKRDIQKIIKSPTLKIPSLGQTVKYRVKFQYELDGYITEEQKTVTVKVHELIKWFTNLRADIKQVSEAIDIHQYHRDWRFTLNLDKLIDDKITINDCKFSINSINGVEVTISDDFKQCEIDSTVINVDVNIKGEVKLVDVILNCLLNYEIDGVANEYSIDMYIGKLPQIGVRLLVNLQTRTNDEVVIQYILENPTNSIFNYITNHVESEGIEIENHHKAGKITLMPFTNQIMLFKYRLLEPVELLPEFTIFDRKFQLFVKPNIASDGLKLLDTRIYLSE